MVSLLNSDTANTNGAAVETKRQPCDCQLYNFGHAPFEVIQKFQEFCQSYKSLTEVLLEILSREPLLKRKYHFIVTPVMYQMLARPTQSDSESILEATIEVLRKFTRRGRYDSVSHAIEELLFSPIQDRPTGLTCDRGTWTSGDIRNNYTELSQDEQNVLEKIADTLIYKINMMTPTPKKRRSAYKPKKDSPAKKRKSNENTPYASPIKNGRTEHISSGKKDNSRVVSNHLCLNSLHHDVSVLRPTEPPDAQLAIPMKNFLEKKSPSRRSAKTADFDPSDKGGILLNLLDLRPVEN